MWITQPQLIEEYYQALVAKDSHYLGTFYVGVTSTGIFCIPTCTARKPKLANVKFYSELKDALDEGFRPCKVCNPGQNAFSAPEAVTAAMSLVKANPQIKVGDSMLRQHNIAPEKVRRWFNKHYGMTFQAYQRMSRINQAFQQVQAGEKTADLAMDSGYDSLSGFGYTFKKLVGKSPQKNRKNRLLLDRFDTPLGPMFVCASDDGICLLEFVDRRGLENEFKDIQRKLDAVILAGENNHIQQCKQELAQYFAHKRQSFSVALDAPGSEFQQRVWYQLQQIPYGQTRSYQQQAEHIGQPTATRAVANANGHNRIAIIIPCHRVIGKDGSLTGYGGGLARKQWLLNLEQG
ncbi:bifunctional transcriptional activator/DNA repair enzyme AdaA [Thalassotalea agarivorans]|uniref:Methylated-DNA--protein-cysteine methyltransferase n=1 Tax=Thalassotalea agarivorans TaxID=349064 RepID=A0A1I0E9A8_THASX|nr:methylated-DNA--[protein]-cysteine S-methyltransferase [Thalassotalea agarivorans]SET41025.1 AraC family transcriptional regulator, regulatory protein of adaptative response / methylated-DNA-[protein]-cysteine methyltransferase [Thalassotalea agarivorans]